LKDADATACTGDCRVKKVFCTLTTDTSSSGAGLASSEGWAGIDVDPIVPTRVS
jgi:hypothetical protein